MNTFATGISLIQYQFLGHEITDRVLMLESDGQIHAHALGINLMSSGRSIAEALDGLDETIHYYINRIEADPDKYVMGEAPDVLSRVWLQIYESTLLKAGSLRSQNLSEIPSEVRIPIAV